MIGLLVGIKALRKQQYSLSSPGNILPIISIDQHIEISHAPLPIDTSLWQNRDRDQPILKFNATAVRMPRQYDPSNPNRQLIHWYVLSKFDVDQRLNWPSGRRGGGAYEESDEERSTSFDTRKNEDSNPVVEIQMISKPFFVSSKAPYYWETPIIKKYTTTDYNGAGSGCLTWTTALIELLENEGVIAVGSKISFLKKVDEVRTDTKYWVPLEPGAEFYN
ncbi:hypothetical protein F5879DRAFT_1035696 [Lentinula edodes]|nr:hypothetical protein F5879DRAFT_1035696 [Lentinula edodes]